jgi:choice-of-anchor B domain-containing protein
MSHLTIDELGGASGLNDIWGWTDFEFCKEYALVGKENGTAFVDITDPMNPCFIGTLPTHTSSSTWRDIKVYNDFAFIVSEAGGHGMQVFDLTRLRNVTDVPTTFDADTHYDGFGNSHNIAINPQTGYAYPIGTSSFSGGPHFINIQNPLNPTAEGGYDGSGYSHDAQIVTYNGPDTEHVGKEIYLGLNGGSGMVIVDITDKSDPELLSTTSYENLVYTHQGWFTGDHAYVLINDEIDEGTFNYNTRTRVFDVSDLDNPVEKPFFASAITSTDHNHYVKGDFVFQSNYTGGLRILDISDIDNDNISEAAFFDVHPGDNQNGYSGTWSNYPYFSSGNVVVTHRQTGLYVVRPTNDAITSATDAVYTHTCDGEIGGGNSNTTLCSIVDGLNEYGGVDYTVFPNPAQNNLSISAVDGIETIELIDITGKVVLFEQMSSRTSLLNLDVSVLSEGIYTLRVNGAASNAQLISITR